MRAYNTPGMSPNLCTEFYTGWLTHWGEAMANTRCILISCVVHFRVRAFPFSTQQLASSLDQLLAPPFNGSVNLYMGIGGTNFGFWNGANLRDSDLESFQPTITSYDYDSP